MKNILALVACLLLSLQAVKAQQKGVILPGELWPDTKGQHIQAHGGGIIKVGSAYYWYGENRRKGIEQDTAYRYVSCYSSKNLMDWKFEGDAIKLAKPDTVLNSKWVLERPKVYYNKRNNNYVMYMHIDGTRPAVPNKYFYARVGIAVSDKPQGPFRFIKTMRPLGQESRDIGQFIDDDGSAYLIFESRPSKGFYIARLSDDYLDVKEETAFIQSPLEGGAIVHYGGLYYVIGSQLTSWEPNANKVSTAKSLSGPWSEFIDIAPPESKTYHSQSTYLLKVTGTKGTTVIFMADQWKPESQWDSRYLWMPVKIGNGRLTIPEPKAWRIDVKTGLAQSVKSGN